MPIVYSNFESVLLEHPNNDTSFIIIEDDKPIKRKVRHSNVKDEDEDKYLSVIEIKSEIRKIQTNKLYRPKTRLSRYRRFSRTSRVSKTSIRKTSRVERVIGIGYQMKYQETILEEKRKQRLNELNNLLFKFLTHLEGMILNRYLNR